ncbi:MAG: hypothetical protein WC667_11100 [Sulfurimonas sp.]|jgi:hypothetical protein
MSKLVACGNRGIKNYEKQCKSSAFERDSNSEVGDLFLQVRDFVKVCMGHDVKEKSSENITSFFSKEG